MEKNVKATNVEETNVEETKPRGFAMQMTVAGKDHIIEPPSGTMVEAVTLMRKKCVELNVKQSEIEGWKKA